MTVIYLVDQGAIIRKKGMRLLVAKEGATVLDMPVLKISNVFLFGNIHFTIFSLPSFLT